jgi:hypothetical protein
LLAEVVVLNQLVAVEVQVVIELQIYPLLLVAKL